MGGAVVGPDSVAGNFVTLAEATENEGEEFRVKDQGQGFVDQRLICGSSLSFSLVSLLPGLFIRGVVSACGLNHKEHT